MATALIISLVANFLLVALVIQTRYELDIARINAKEARDLLAIEQSLSKTWQTCSEKLHDMITGYAANYGVTKDK